ncbi:hypothetical protein C8J57DRAFT_1728274 [Mycena rebaudengoi]|nr:hypothetical protein C8J57DRAFT_1728274 [Mycena rebaudengoi]
MDVIVLDQYAAGKRMHVHMAQYSANGNLQTVALKKIVIPGPWFELWHNKSVATWVEGARLAECGILWLAFASRVRAVDIDLVGVEVLETVSFCQDDNIYLAQSWECGSRFFVNTWGSDLPMHSPVFVEFEGGSPMISSASALTFRFSQDLLPKRVTESLIRALMLWQRSQMNMTMILCETPFSKVSTLKESRISPTTTPATQFAGP